MDLAFLGLGDSQCILEAALDEICQGCIPTYLGPLTTVDKALDVWNDREKLQSASVAIFLAMRQNTNFDVILHTCLTRMIGVLNLYLDPDLSYIWRKASVMVSKIEGKGVNQV